MHTSVHVALMLIGGVPSLALAQSISFTEVSQEAGISAKYGTIDTGFRGLSYMMAGGAVADFNNDGWPDLFVLTGDQKPDKLYINNQDGTFTDEAPAWGVDRVHVGGGASVGDFNGDGFPDMYITSMGPGNDNRKLAQHILYRNNGDGTFTDVAEAAGVKSLGAAEPDGFGSAFGDYDLDGDLDLVVAMWSIRNHGLTLFRNDGDGTFSRRNEIIGLDTANIHGFTPAFVDMDGDRYPEIVVAADFETSSYFRNNTDGTFTRVSREDAGLVDTNGMGAVVCDLNGDGLLDWFVSNICCAGPEEVWEGQNLFQNNGDHSFTDIAPMVGVENADWAWGADACDLNNDGAVELIVANGWFFDGAMANKLFRNNDDGTFTEIGALAGFEDRGLARGLASMDYDRDGDLDLVVFNHEGPTLLYRNDLPYGVAVPLTIKLDTLHRPDLAPNGVGAVIELVNEGETDMRYIDGAPTFLAVSELSEHFGLGTDRVADLIRVKWPDGSISEHPNLKGGVTYTISAPPTCRFPDTDGDTVPDWGNFDPDRSGATDVEDLYAAATFVFDVNDDGLTEVSDAQCMTAYLRASEKQDALGNAR